MLLGLTTACAPLSDVRQYSEQSAKLAAYKTLTDRFRSRYDREKAFVGISLSCARPAIAEQYNQRRQAAYPDLVNMHDLMGSYMAILATLAGSDTFDLSKSIQGLGKSISEHPDLGISADRVQSYTQLATIVTGIVTRGVQQHAIGKTVIEADPSVQNLLQGMLDVLAAYDISNENERGCVVGYLMLAAASPPTSSREALLTALAKNLAQEKDVEYDRIAAATEQAMQGIAAIKAGHTKLRENVSTLTSAELKTELERLTNEIGEARKALAKLG